MLELCFYKYTAGDIRKQRIIPYIYYIIPCLLSDYSLLKISWYFTIALSKTSKIPNKILWLCRLIFWHFLYKYRDGGSWEERREGKGIFYSLELELNYLDCRYWFPLPGPLLRHAFIWQAPTDTEVSSYVTFLRLLCLTALALIRNPCYELSPHLLFPLRTLIT